MYPTCTCSARHELAALSKGRQHSSDRRILYRSPEDTDYSQVNAHDEDDEVDSHSSIPLQTAPTPSSPPPSFRSRSSSFSSRRLLQNDPHRSDADQTLADAFGDASDSEGDDEPDDRQRLMRAHPEQPTGSGGEGAPSSAASNEQPPQRNQSSSTLQRRPTILPSFSTPSSGAGRVISSSNDGVFANLAAKPERGEKNEDLPPVSMLPGITRHKKLTSIVLRRSSCRRHPSVLGDYHLGSRHLV